MNNVEQVLSKIQEDLYNLSPEEQNELLLTLMKNIQTKRRADMQYLEEQKSSLQSIFDKLKTDACQASNLSKS